MPTKQSKRGRLWLADGWIVRLRPEFPKHVWSYDFMQDGTHDGRPFRILNLIHSRVPGRARQTQAEPPRCLGSPDRSVL